VTEAPVTNGDMIMLRGLAEEPRVMPEMEAYVQKMVRAGLAELSLDPVEHYTTARPSFAGAKALRAWLDQPAGRFTVELAARQREALQFIEERVRRTRKAPTQEEIAKALGCSRGRARRLVVELGDRGFIDRSLGQWRGIQLRSGAREIEASP
jgi:hypothetical protein